MGVNVPRVAKCPGQTDKAKATHVGDLHLTSWENWHAPHGLVFKQPKVTAAQTPENGNGPEGLYLIQPDDLGLEEQGGGTCSLQEDVDWEEKREVTRRRLGWGAGFPVALALLPPCPTLYTQAVSIILGGKGHCCPSQRMVLSLGF